MSTAVLVCKDHVVINLDTFATSTLPIDEIFGTAEKPTRVPIKNPSVESDESSNEDADYEYDEEYADEIENVFFSNCGTKLAIVTFDKIVAYCLTTKTILCEIPNEAEKYALCMFTRNSNSIVARTDIGTVVVYDLITKELIKKYEFDTHVNVIAC